MGNFGFRDEANDVNEVIVEGAGQVAGTEVVVEPVVGPAEVASCSRDVGMLMPRLQGLPDLRVRLRVLEQMVLRLMYTEGLEKRARLRGESSSDEEDINRNRRRRRRRREDASEESERVARRRRRRRHRNENDRHRSER